MGMLSLGLLIFVALIVVPIGLFARDSLRSSDMRLQPIRVRRSDDG